MKENDVEKDLFLSIDQDLKNMASDVPEMPDSFRSGWRQAIRNEAEKSSPAPEQIPPESAVSAETVPVETRVRRPRRWTYLLSAAAALIFLFAGTLATRGMLSPRLKKAGSDPGVSTLSAVREAGVSDAAVNPPQADSALSAANDAAYETDSASREDRVSAAEESVFSAANDTAYETDSASREDRVSAAEESALFFSYMESAEEYEGSPKEEAFPDSGSLSAGKSDGAVPSQAAGNSDRFSAENAESEGLGSAAPLPAASTEAPASLMKQPPSAAPTAEPPAGENIGTRITWFLEDMGAFVLAALPYMAAAGVLLLIILIIKRKKAKKDEENVR